MPSVRLHQALQYMGRLKSPPQRVTVSHLGL